MNPVRLLLWILGLTVAVAALAGALRLITTARLRRVTLTDRELADERERLLAYVRTAEPSRAAPDAGWVDINAHWRTREVGWADRAAVLEPLLRDRTLERLPLAGPPLGIVIGRFLRWSVQPPVWFVRLRP